MNDKKKYHGGLKLLFLPLFIMLLGIFSSCYAVDYSELENCSIGDMTSEHLRASFNLLNTVSNGNYSMFRSFYNWLESDVSRYSTLLSRLKNVMTDDIKNSNISNLLVLCNSSQYVYFVFNNNSYNENFGFLNIKPNGSFLNFGYRNDISDDFASGYPYISFMNFGSSYQNPTLYTSSTNSLSILSVSQGNSYQYIDFNNRLFLNNCVGFGKMDNINEIDIYAQITPDLNPTWYMLSQDCIVQVYNDSIPVEPSGDDGGSGDSGGGTVIPSGDDSSSNIDYTNQLNNINNNITNVQNQISGDSQRIIDNQNNNTQHVVNALSGETNKITNTLTDYNVNDGQNDVSSLIDNINDTLSGDISNSEIFGALEESEKGFLDLISGQAADFEIHWNDVFYNNVKLIPAGQVNFSKICRDNETLGNVKEKLNIILSALCGLALIRYLYNLLLATLGIDNPYLYENSSDEHVKASSVHVRDTTKFNYTSYDKHGNVNGWGRDEK